MSRKTARVKAFETIYQYLIGGETDCVPETEALSDEDLAYSTAVSSGVIGEIDDLKAAIAAAAIGYELDRIYKVDLAILLVALYEIRHSTELSDPGPEVNKAIACSEAVNLAKKYSTLRSPSFVNGILAKLD